MRPLPRNGDVLRKAVIDSKQSMEGQIRLASQWNPCNTRSLAMKTLTTEYTIQPASLRLSVLALCTCHKLERMLHLLCCPLLCATLCLGMPYTACQADLFDLNHLAGFEDFHLRYRVVCKVYWCRVTGVTYIITVCPHTAYLSSTVFSKDFQQIQRSLHALS